MVNTVTEVKPTTTVVMMCRNTRKVDDVIGVTDKQLAAFLPKTYDQTDVCRTWILFISEAFISEAYTYALHNDKESESLAPSPPPKEATKEANLSLTGSLLQVEQTELDRGLTTSVVR